MFERFTDRARRILVLAQEEARLLNHNFIGSEHLLLGLIQEGEGVAARALSDLGISLVAVREKVEETIGFSGGQPLGSPPFTPRAKKVLELSLREALQLGDTHIGTEHILLGIVREERVSAPRCWQARVPIFPEYVSRSSRSSPYTRVTTPSAGNQLHSHDGPFPVPGL